jgi:hypothetical protein
MYHADMPSVECVDVGQARSGPADANPVDTLAAFADHLFRKVI